MSDMDQLLAQLRGMVLTPAEAEAAIAVIRSRTRARQDADAQPSIVTDAWLRALQDKVETYLTAREHFRETPDPDPLILAIPVLVGEVRRLNTPTKEQR